MAQSHLVVEKNGNISHMTRLSIVIPTRERADTLYYTLQTVVSQTCPDLEIIVSDNCSMDHTRDVVLGFDDPRIIYTRTDKRLGMASNWEHGLSLVTGEYVMFLGDDDGLLPNACNDVSALLDFFDTNALIWLKPDYNWPGAVCENQLTLQIRNHLMEMHSNTLLKALAMGFISYNRLPGLYSGFVSTSSIQRIKKYSDRFFGSITPDVYSGIVLAGQMESYYYSTRPFSVNGGSVHSNGQASAASSDEARVFLSEADLPVHKKIFPVPGSIMSCVAEAFLQAQDRSFTNGIRLNENRYFSIIFNELAGKPRPVAIDGMRQLAQCDLPQKIQNKIQEFLNNPETFSFHMSPPVQTKDNFLSINAHDFGVQDVYGACSLAGGLLGKYSKPVRLKKADANRLMFTKVYGTLKKRLDTWELPF
jgi:hypothetical protein